MKFAFQAVPSPTQRVAVVDGIDWLRMPLPFALDHVNCWLLGSADNQTLIDTGVDDEATRAYWLQVFPKAHHWPKQLLVTHFHPDHMGLAGWFEQSGSQQFQGSSIEVELASRLWAIEDSEYANAYAQWYSCNGLPAEFADRVKRYGNTYRSKAGNPPLADRWGYLSDADTLQFGNHQYTVMKGRGHAPDMIMLYRDEGHVLIAADQVLPSISPNVSVMPLQLDANPLASFLDTLSGLLELPEDTLVLPSHGIPFHGLHERIKILQDHHDQRLAQVLEACKQPSTAHDMFTVLFNRQLDAQQTAFALGESLAHLHFLEHQGSLVSTMEQGIKRFQQT